MTFVFWPPRAQEFIQSEAIAKSGRSEAKQGEVRYKILKRVGDTVKYSALLHCKHILK